MAGASGSGDQRGQLRRADPGGQVISRCGREQAVVDGVLALAGDVVEVPARVEVVQQVHQRVEVAGAVAGVAVAVGRDPGPERRRQAGPADAEPARHLLDAAQLRAHAVRRAGVAGAELAVRRELVRAGRDVGQLTARRALRGQRAVGRAVAVRGELVVDARTLLVERTTPERAGPAAATAGGVAPEQTGLTALVGAGVAELVDVPDALHARRVGRVRVAAGVEVLPGRAARGGHPGLRRRVVHGRGGRAGGVEAVERAIVAGRREDALPLQRHLLEDHVLGLGRGRALGRLALTPAGADRRRLVVVGDLGVLVELGLAGLVVGGVVDDEVADVGRDGQLLLEVGVDLDVTGVALDLGRAGVPDRALRVQRAAVHVHIAQRRGEVLPVVVVRPVADVGRQVGGQLEHGRGPARALAPGARVRRAVQGVGLRRGQAAAAGPAAVAGRDVLVVDVDVDQLGHGRVGGLAAGVRRRRPLGRARRRLVRH